MTFPREYFCLRSGLSNARLTFERTKKGRVAFLGGSITELAGWRDLVCEDLEKRFPETAFDFINAGISSTGSTPGAFRLERDVLGIGLIDLFFEEAAVNDQYNGRDPTEQVRGMEGIVRHARRKNPKTDMVMLHFVDPPKMEEYNKGNLPEVVQNHESVAVHYDVPSVHLAQEVTERIRAGEFEWERDFHEMHPSPFGHQLYAKTISRLFDAAWDSPIEKADKPIPHPLPEKLDPFCYDNGILLACDGAERLNGFHIDPKWTNLDGAGVRDGFVNVPMLVGDRPGDSFELSFLGSAVGLWIVSGPDAGIIKYSIDGSPATERNLFVSSGENLHLPWMHMLEAELAAGEHRLRVSIVPEKDERSKGNACRIVHFALDEKARTNRD